ncbi:MAG TPA: GNAT family acetyltransferase [Abditibacteriaceae bacterium]|jgi:ribosomal protein S18 acetylase RimI-like enzyme
MTIRPFEISDSKPVIALWRECGLIVPWNDPQRDIERKMQVQPELFFVGEIEGRIVATLMAGYEGHRGWLNYVAVAPDAHRQGLGRQIVEHAIEQLRKRGCPKINLQVRTSNAEVIAFYESLGFQVDDATSLGMRLISDG